MLSCLKFSPNCSLIFSLKSRMERSRASVMALEVLGDYRGATLGGQVRGLDDGALVLAASFSFGAPVYSAETGYSVIPVRILKL